MGALRLQVLRRHPGVAHVDPDGTSPPVSTGLPSPPANVAATAVSAFSLRLTWVASTNTNAYLVQRLYSTLFMDCSPRLAPNATSFDVTDLSPGTAYSFRVLASNEAGATESSTVSVSTLPFPAKPENVKVTAASSTASLTWNDASNNETGFRVQYSKDGGKTWTVLDKVLPPNTVKYEVKELAADTPYIFQVGSYNGVDIHWSEHAPAKTATAGVQVTKQSGEVRCVIDDVFTRDGKDYLVVDPVSVDWTENGQSCVVSNSTHTLKTFVIPEGAELLAGCALLTKLIGKSAADERSLASSDGEFVGGPGTISVDELKRAAEKGFINSYCELDHWYLTVSSGRVVNLMAPMLF